jgi:GT2 family glycosyltransferase
MKNKLVSVNILTYNGQDLIESCLKSVLGQTYKNVEILIIDNASTDKTLERVKSFPIKIIKNKKNLGFSIGHNEGIRKSRGKYVLCLNQDVVLDKDFIKKALEAMEKNKRIGSVQGKLLGIRDINKPKSDIIDHTGLIMLKNRRVIARGQGEKDNTQYKAGEIFGVDGAAPLYRREALEHVKIDNEYFDEIFFTYKEDVDLAWRMQLYGWKAIYQPKAIAYHLRTAGERAVRNYISVALERRRLSKFAKFYSFKNDRLMRIKNELPGLFLRDIFYIIIKEIGAWAYVLFFETYSLKALKALIKEIPNARKKRKIIMARKKVSSKQMKKWFR